jgi:hypothetical protein
VIPLLLPVMQHLHVSIITSNLTEYFDHVLDVGWVPFQHDGTLTPPPPCTSALAALWLRYLANVAQADTSYSPFVLIFKADTFTVILELQPIASA